MSELEQYKNLVQAQKQYREDSHTSFCEDVAKALRPEYEDFLESKDLPMNDMLGEIYREKLIKIMKILHQKGINI